MRIRPVPMYLRDASFEPRPDGSLLVRRPEPLGPYPSRLTERLEHWAARAPDRVFLARRAGDSWRRVSYAQAGSRLRHRAGAARPWTLPHATGPDLVGQRDRARRVIACLPARRRALRAGLTRLFVDLHRFRQAARHRCVGASGAHLC
jgi:hypothetical protein